MYINTLYSDLSSYDVTPAYGVDGTPNCGSFKGVVCGLSLI